MGEGMGGRGEEQAKPSPLGGVSAFFLIEEKENLHVLCVAVLNSTAETVQAKEESPHAGRVGIHL